jgi:hypothetical protein
MSYSIRVIDTHLRQLRPTDCSHNTINDQSACLTERSYIHIEPPTTPNKIYQPIQPPSPNHVRPRRSKQVLLRLHNHRPLPIPTPLSHNPPRPPIRHRPCLLPRQQSAKILPPNGHDSLPRIQPPRPLDAHQPRTNVLSRRPRSRRPQSRLCPELNLGLLLHHGTQPPRHAVEHRPHNKLQGRTGELLPQTTSLGAS